MTSTDAGNVEGEIILIADPRILSVQIIDNDEPMFDMREQNSIVIGPSPEVPNNIDYTFVRQSVYERLRKAEGQLPYGLQFCLYEGYRSLSLQKMLYDERYARLKVAHPDWSSERLFNETTKLVSPITNQDGSTNVPPHSTGAAIDVYLLDDSGNPLDMGIHPKDWMDDEDGLLSLTLSRAISKDAQKNRQIMSEVLSDAGFVNYPTEYWHWSYGDRYWAYMQKRSHANYGTYSG